jgi:hypothetical protein
MIIGRRGRRPFWGSRAEPPPSYDHRNRPLRADPGAVCRAHSVDRAVNRSSASAFGVDGGWQVVCVDWVRADGAVTAVADACLRDLGLHGDQRRGEQPHRQAVAVSDHRRVGEPRGFHAAVGVHAVAVRRGGGAVQQQSAPCPAGPSAGGAGYDRGRVSAVHPADVQPVPADVSAAAERPGAESGAARPGFGVPSAVPLPRLCRILGGIFLRRRRADRGPCRCRMGALGAAMDAGVVVCADRGNRDGVLVGVLHAGLGRLVVLGPGRECLVHAVAGRHRADSLVYRGGKAGLAEILDHSAGNHHVLAFAGRCMRSPPIQGAACSSCCC